MKRSPMPPRKKPVNPKSQKQLDYDHEYRSHTRFVKVRSGGRCEILAAHDCDGTSTPYPHHRKRRSQGGSNSLDNLLDVCFTGHQWLHVELPWLDAIHLGLLVKQSDTEYAYDPFGSN